MRINNCFSCHLLRFFRMMPQLFIAVCSMAFVVSSPSFGQSIDSARQQISQLPNDTAKVNKLHALIFKELYDLNAANPESILQARKLAKALKYDFGIARNHELSGLINLQKGELDSAQFYFLLALTEYEALNNKSSIAEAYGHLGKLQVYRNDLDKAEQFFQKSLEYSSGSTDNAALAKINNNFAALYIRKGWTYDKVSQLKERREQFNKAVPFLNETIRQSEIANLPRGTGTGYVNLGIVEMELGNYASSHGFMDRAIQKFEEHNIVAALVNVYGYKGDVYEAMGSYDSALYWARKGLDLAIDTDNRNEVLTGYLRGRQLYEKLSNYQAALRYQDLYDSTNSIMLNEQKQKTIDELEIKYESERQQLELTSQQTVIARQKMQLYVVIAVCLLLLYLSYRVWRNKEKVRQLNILLKEKSNELNKTSFEVTRKNAALNEVIQQQNNLMAIVTHDLRAPLGNLSGLLQLIEKSGKLNADQQEIQQKALQVTTDGLNLVEDIYSIRSQGVESEPQLENVNLEKLFAEVVLNHQPAAQTKAIGISIDNRSAAGCDTMKTDRLMLVRILNNLLSNAIKFSPPEQHITLQYTVNTKQTEIRIIDNGPGLSIEDQRQAFQRFKKLSARPTGGEGSSGLGLFIVKMLTEKLSGSVSIESTPGKGASFIVVLPS